ncbi:DUF4097 domain-containing protein [Marinobacter hydrocarbonoclasticus]|nr:DUF4097 domain-containing protein [Marinobacter nauticus]
MKLRCALLTLPLLLSGCVIHIDGSYACDSADYEQHETLVLDSAGLTAFKVDAGAGRLDIIGEPGRDTISVEAVLYSTGPEADEHEFGLEQQGSTAVLTATQTNMMSCGRQSPHINMVVKVPAELDLNVDDGSGALEIVGMAGKLTIEDGSGNLVIDGGQQLTLDDGSGDARIRNIQGDANIEDGSGNLWISKVGGNLEVEDGSGDLEVTEVGGYARVDDGSGNLSVEAVQGPVTVDDGSGDIRIRQTGGFTLLEGGSGGLSVENVNGPVTLN